MKKSINHSLSLLFAVITIGFMSHTAIVSASTCVQINSDLSYGQTDSTSGGSIMMLQNYLQLNGFLASNPNGHFGPATLSAVKAFQTSVGISSTGYVGSKTRGYISQKTCNTTIVSNVPQVTAPAPTPVAVVSNTSITSPATGQVLSIGSSTVIRWINPVVGIYNIGLEQPGGAGAGFIALNQSSNTTGNQYVWSAGKIYSSQTNSNQVISPGTYRIRLESTVSGTSQNDQVSGWFTVVAQQFVVNSVVPTSAYADNTTSIVLFGSGFTSASSVYFDTNYSNLRANNKYISPDGTVLVFTIPTAVSVGSHTLFINNGANSTPASLSFTVSSIQ